MNSMTTGTTRFIQPRPRGFDHLFRSKSLSLSLPRLCDPLATAIPPRLTGISPAGIHTVHVSSDPPMCRLSWCGGVEWVAESGNTRRQILRLCGSTDSPNSTSSALRIAGSNARRESDHLLFDAFRGGAHSGWQGDLPHSFGTALGNRCCRRDPRADHLFERPAQHRHRRATRHSRHRRR